VQNEVLMCRNISGRGCLRRETPTYKTMAAVRNQL
jgi:hypothetical protein